MSVIYLDMDGVIADFFGGLERKYDAPHWKSIKWKESIYVDLRYTDFFFEIPLFDNTLDIVNLVKSAALFNDLSWGICSSPLKGDEVNSAYWKRRWLEKHRITPDIENLIFTANKEKYYLHQLDWRPNILIDDKQDNIDRWNAAGGIGIRFQANRDDLNEYLKPELEKAVAIINGTAKMSDRV